MDKSVKVRTKAWKQSIDTRNKVITGRKKKKGKGGKGGKEGSGDVRRGPARAAEGRGRPRKGFGLLTT